MRNRFLRVAAALLSLGLASSVHTQNSDPMQAIKDTLGSDQGNSLIQSVLGKGDGTGKRSDKKLDNPDDSTLQKATERMDPVRHVKKEETFDERVLRQSDEDPELRPDDSILIELTPVELAAAADAANNQNNANGNGGVSGGSPPGFPGAAGSAGGTNVNGLAGVLAGGGYNATNNGSGSTGNSVNNPNGANFNNNVSLGDKKPRTDEEKERIEKYRQRIQSNNPYQLTHTGVLEIPGMPGIPLAGLTAAEATRRLSADPGF